MAAPRYPRRPWEPTTTIHRYRGSQEWASALEPVPPDLAVRLRAGDTLTDWTPRLRSKAASPDVDRRPGGRHAIGVAPEIQCAHVDRSGRWCTKVVYATWSDVRRGTPVVCAAHGGDGQPTQPSRMQARGDVVHV
jgi:hypothetical protein